MENENLKRQVKYVKFASQNGKPSVQNISL
jgi:hypothetical protein